MTSQMRELAGEVLQEHIVQGRPAADSIWARGAGPLVQSWDRCKKFVTALKESISTLASASICQVPTTGGRGWEKTKTVKSSVNTIELLPLFLSAFPGLLAMFYQITCPYGVEES